MAKKHRAMDDVPEDSPADFTLTYQSHGAVDLRDINGKLVWSSDADEDFAESFEGDFFDDDDTDEILDYLAEQGYLDSETDEIDIVENDADDESGFSDNVLEGSFKRKN